MKNNNYTAIKLIAMLLISNMLFAQQEIFVDLSEQRAYAINN